MIKPIGQRVLVKRVEAEEKTKGGLYLPENAQEKSQHATVIAVGTGGRDKEGNPIAFSVKENDKVLIARYGGAEIRHNGENYLIISEADILAIID